MNPLISIIVPTYYRPQLLRRALASIASQTFGDFETIVINDGGEDVSNVVNEFEKTRYISLKENCGLPAARNYGIRAAKAKYIAYLDDDDWYYPQHLLTCIEFARKHERRFVYTNADAYDYSGRVKIFIDRDYDPDRIKRENITPVCCVLHERSLIDQAGWFDETLQNHEDWDLWIRMSNFVEPLHIHETTCCIDRSRATMSSDPRKMDAGHKVIRERYA